MISLVRSPPSWAKPPLKKKKQSKPKKTPLFVVYEDTPRETRALRRQKKIAAFKDEYYKVLPKPEMVFDKPKKPRKVVREYVFLRPSPGLALRAEMSPFYPYARRKKKVIRSKNLPKSRRKYQKTGLQKIFERLK